MRNFAKTAIGAVEGSQVKMGHGVSNLPGKMIAGQFLVEFTPTPRVFSPRGWSKTRERLGIKCGVDYHLYGLLGGGAVGFGHLYSARKPKKSKRLGGHFRAQLVIIFGYQ
jgi:hypothetical protein